MKYKLLYIEDQEPQALAYLLEKENLFEIEFNDASNVDGTLNLIMDNGYDIFLMDFELTSGHGRVDAPTYASTLRTKLARHKNSPIILVSSHNNIKKFKQDFSNYELFDIVVTKEEFCNRSIVFSHRMYDLIEAYKTIESAGYDVCKTLSIENNQSLDYRFVHYLDEFKERNDIYGFCHFIQKTFLQSIGPLVGKEVLASRFGIDKKCADFNNFLSNFQNYKYEGILSHSYERWWFDDILSWWNQEFDGEYLRLLEASERVKMLNAKLNLNLTPCQPIEFNQSACFWSICAATKAPIDPNEGFVILNDKIYPWQEQEYLSLKAVCENEDLLRSKLCSSDRKKILKWSYEIKNK